MQSENESMRRYSECSQWTAADTQSENIWHRKSKCVSLTVAMLACDHRTNNKNRHSFCVRNAAAAIHRESFILSGFIETWNESFRIHSERTRTSMYFAVTFRLTFFRVSGNNSSHDLAYNRIQRTQRIEAQRRIKCENDMLSRTQSHRARSSFTRCWKLFRTLRDSLQRRQRSWWWWGKKLCARTLDSCENNTQLYYYCYCILYWIAGDDASWMFCIAFAFASSASAFVIVIIIVREI